MFASLAALLLTAAPAPAAAPAAPPAERPAATHTAIDATVTLAGDQAACLEHAIVELSLGAKRQGDAWQAKGALLHATIASELNVLLRLQRSTGDVKLLLHTDWPGAPREPALQAELEARHVTAMVRAGRICGVVNPMTSCTVTPAGGAPKPCTPAAR